MPHPVVEAAERYRAQLLAQEQQAATRLVEAYGRAFADLQTEYEALSQAIPLLGDNVTDAEIRRLASLRSLRAQIAAQVERYAAFADVEISAAVSRSIELGLQGSLGTVQAYFSNARTQAAIGARWDMLAPETVETMLGYTAADSPLRQALVGRLGPTLAERVSDALVTAIATGTNPRDVAALFRREMGLGLTWSLTTARTAQLWSYRDATLLNFRNNRDVVSGWRWQAALDSRTCPVCWAMHGTVHELDEQLEGHHNCRCTMIPIVPLAARLGIKPPDATEGSELFQALSDGEKRNILGPSKFEAWKRGEFDLPDLIKEHEDPIYGTMLVESSLQDMLGERAKDYTGRSR